MFSFQPGSNIFSGHRILRTQSLRVNQKQTARREPRPNPLLVLPSAPIEFVAAQSIRSTH